MAFTDNSTGGRSILQGHNPVTITLTDTCTVGDLIGFDAVSSNAWEKADADGKVYAELIAGEACGTSGDSIVCYRSAVIRGITGVDGDAIYLSDTAGAYASAPGGSWSQAVGKCVSTTDMLVVPSAMPVSAYDGTGTGFAGFFRSEVESGRTSAGRCGGIEVQSKVISGASLGGDLYGAYIFVQWQDTDAGTATSSILRLEDGCSTSCHPDAFIIFIPGAVGPDYMFDFGSISAPTGGSVAGTGTAKTGNGGWLKCKTSNGTRYINMYTG